MVALFVISQHAVGGREAVVARALEQVRCSLRVELRVGVHRHLVGRIHYQRVIRRAAFKFCCGNCCAVGLPARREQFRIDRHVAVGVRQSADCEILRRCRAAQRLVEEHSVCHQLEAMCAHRVIRQRRPAVGTRARHEARAIRAFAPVRPRARSQCAEFRLFHIVAAVSQPAYHRVVDRRVEHIFVRRYFHRLPVRQTGERRLAQRDCLYAVRVRRRYRDVVNERCRRRQFHVAREPDCVCHFVIDRCRARSVREETCRRAVAPQARRREHRISQRRRRVRAAARYLAHVDFVRAAFARRRYRDAFRLVVDYFERVFLERDNRVRDCEVVGYRFVGRYRIVFGRAAQRRFRRASVVSQEAVVVHNAVGRVSAEVCARAA